jgi:glycosyltransferase involved in cell wall biosynthesis
LEPGQVEVVYDGVVTEAAPLPEQRSRARRRLGVAGGEFLIGCVGHFTPEKGHALLIRGFSEILRTHPETRLAVVGEGPLRGELERLIRERGLQGRAVLTGFVSDLDCILPGFDLLVHPSLDEGLGSVLLQAMSRRVPLCASRTGGIPEAVIEGETGFLFSPGSTEALVRSVLRARSNPDLTGRQAERAAARVRSAFSVERMVADTGKVYSEILNR